MNTLDAAVHYATERGWPCFPCVPDAKRPATPNGLHDATKDPGRLRSIWKYGANLGVRTGEASGIFALDVDVKDGASGRESLEQLQHEHGALPVTLTNATPTGGSHLLFRHPTHTLGNRAGLLPGLDVRGDGGYIVVPPSVIGGCSYHWINEDEQIAEAPAWLVALISASADSKLDLGAVLAGVSQGARNDQLFRYAAKLRGDDFAPDDARRLVLDMAARCAPPMDPEEALACLASAWRYAPRTHLTDLGNAQRFVVRHGVNARYLHEFKKWVTWGDARWHFDEDGEAARLAKETARSLYAEAAEESDDNRRAAVGKWAAASESATRLKAITELAKTEPGVPVRANELDRDPWLLGVANGVLDLRTGTLRTPRREDYITKRAHVEFHAGAACPMWLAFLDRIFAGKVSLIEFMQRTAGYSLTGSTAEQCLFLLWGSGANGKSTLVNALRAMLGDYATQADAATFMARDRGGASSDIARLRGARLVAAVETEDGQRLAESLVKQLTGQDTIAARFLYGEHFEFSPAFKLWLAANHKPVVRGDDYAIWRRIHLIPFTVQIPEAERDKELPEKLRAELPGILNWSLEGCRAWQAQGLVPPEEVRAATAEYRREMDLLQDFFDACCVAHPAARGPQPALYAAYKAWAEAAGHHPMSSNKFGRKLGARGFEKRHTGKGIEYLGIGLREDRTGGHDGSF